MAPVSTNFLPAGFWGFGDIDEVAVPRGSSYGCEESHVLAVVGFDPGGSLPGDLRHKRQRIDGTWTLFTSLSGGLSGTYVPAKPWRFGRVSAAGVNEELHVCAVTIKPTSYARDAGILAHAVRRFDATADEQGLELAQWNTDWEDISAFTGPLGRAVDVGAAGVNNASGTAELHVCVVTEDGRLLHTIRTGPTSWMPLGDVAVQAGARGPFKRVDCAAEGSQLHVVAVSQDGRAWYTIRNSTASWQAFEDVQNAAAAPFTVLGQIEDVGIGFFNVGLPSGASQLIIVALGMPAFYTVRSSQPRAWQPATGPSHWKPWTNLESETSYADGGRMTTASVARRPFLP